MIVVSDTSPVMNLAAIGRLSLLQALYGDVIIPRAVYDEVLLTAAALPGQQAVSEADWIEVRHIQDSVMVQGLRLELDEGEAQAIALAVELQADLLLLDERRGRAIASRLGLRLIGLLGLLIEAKRRGIISDVKPVLDDLIGKVGFWVSKQLYDRVLEVAEEGSR